MKKLMNYAAIAAITIAFLGASTLYAQERPKEQAEQEFELPRLYMEQKWATAAGNLAAHMIAGIAFAKTKGVTPEEYGKFVGELHGQYWDAEEQNPVKFFTKGMYINMNSFEDFQMEILGMSDSSVKARMNRKWEDAFKGFDKYGTTTDEFHNCLDKLWIAIAKNLGLEYDQKFEEEWIIVTVTKK